MKEIKIYKITVNSEVMNTFQIDEECISAEKEIFTHYQIQQS